jgi:predicted NBD/HSP70 family sugar kinase
VSAAGDTQPRRRPGATTRAVATHNATLIVDVMRGREPMSRREIAQHTGLSIATVNRLTEQLLSRGLLGEDRQPAQTGGRPARTLRYNGSQQGVLVFDLGPEKTTGAVVDLDGQFVYREVRPTAVADDGDAGSVFGQLLRFARDTIEQTSSRCRVAALGVSVPGVVRPQSGLVDFAPALQWWAMPLGQSLSAELGIPVMVENDVNALALAEHRRGAGVGTQHMVAISVGTGIGAGLILNSELHRGWQGGAGELGYLLVEPASLGRLWPAYGDLESRIGKAGIEQRARQVGADSVPALLAAARGGEAAAQQVVDAITDELTLAVANISVITSPELVVIGGQIGRAAQQIVAGVASRLAGRIPTVPKITPMRLADAELLGAAELATDLVLRSGSEFGAFPR